jgi:hypothetical protein
LWKILVCFSNLCVLQRASVSTDARPLSGHMSVLEKMRAGSAAAAAVSSSFRQTPAESATTTTTTTTTTASVNAAGQSISSLNYSPSRSSIRKRAIMSNPSAAMLQHNAAQMVEEIEDVDEVVAAQPPVEKRARTNTMMSETQADLDALIAESQADDLDVDELPPSSVFAAPVSATTVSTAPPTSIAADALPPPASWAQRDSWVELTSISTEQFKSQKECSLWALNELKKQTKSSTALAAWALTVV